MKFSYSEKFKMDIKKKTRHNDESIPLIHMCTTFDIRVILVLLKINNKKQRSPYHSIDQITYK